jgi:hypothetical protein
MRSFNLFSSISSAFFRAKASRLTAAAVSFTGASTLSKFGVFRGLVPENLSFD